MNKDIFLAIINRTCKEWDEKQIEIIFSNIHDNIYDETKVLIAKIALSILELDKINKGATVWALYDRYYMNSENPEFDIFHCIDHGFAKKIDGKFYIRCLVTNNPIYGEIKGCYTGCDVNGNAIKLDREIHIKRNQIINVKNQNV